MPCSDLCRIRELRSTRSDDGIFQTWQSSDNKRGKHLSRSATKARFPGHSCSKGRVGRFRRTPFVFYVLEISECEILAVEIRKRNKHPTLHGSGRRKRSFPHEICRSRRPQCSSLSCREGKGGGVGSLPSLTSYDRSTARRQPNQFYTNKQ